jgi:hydroxymethylbilane synthase
MSKNVVRVATRSSPLALFQSNDVADRLRAAAGVNVELVPVDTLGDRTQSLGTPLHEIGGQGVFAKEVQAAVLDGRADIAVHSAKDLPGEPMPGLIIASVPRRDDPRDGLVGSTLEALPIGAVVATGSIRRRAQLLSLRPDLSFVEVRGNMAKRVAKADEVGVDAVVVGCAGLDRIDLGHHIVQRLDPLIMLPQVGQAAVAVECRADDTSTYELLRQINDAELEFDLLLERSFLRRLGAGCSLPIGAFAQRSLLAGGHPNLSLQGMIAAMDGSVVLRTETMVDTGDLRHATAGAQLADTLLAMGGSDLLAGL